MSKFIAHLSTNKIIISTKTAVSGFKQAFATVTTALGNMQPLSSEKTQLFEGKMGKTYVIYVDGALDINEGDRLRDTATSEIYQVKNGGVSRRTHGAIDYKQVVIEKLD